MKMNKLESFLTGSGESVFDEEVWAAAVEAAEKQRNPNLMFGLEERIVEYMTLEVATCSENAAETIERVEKVVKDGDVLQGTLTKPYVEALRQRITGAAATLKTLLEGREINEDIESLMFKAEEDRNEGQRKAVGGLGVKILEGEPIDFTYKTSNERVRNQLQGAKLVKDVMARHNILNPPENI